MLIWDVDIDIDIVIVATVLDITGSIPIYYNSFFQIIYYHSATHSTGIVSKI